MSLNPINLQSNANEIRERLNNYNATIPFLGTPGAPLTEDQVYELTNAIDIEQELMTLERQVSTLPNSEQKGNIDTINAISRSILEQLQQLKRAGRNPASTDRSLSDNHVVNPITPSSVLQEDRKIRQDQEKEFNEALASTQLAEFNKERKRFNELSSPDGPKFEDALKLYQDMRENYADLKDFKFENASSSINEFMQGIEKLLTELIERQRMKDMPNRNPIFNDLRTCVDKCCKQNDQTPFQEVNLANGEVQTICESLSSEEKTLLLDNLNKALVTKGKLTANQPGIPNTCLTQQFMVWGRTFRADWNDKLAALDLILALPKEPAADSPSAIMSKNFATVKDSNLMHPNITSLTSSMTPPSAVPSININTPPPSAVPSTVMLPQQNDRNRSNTGVKSSTYTAAPQASSSSSIKRPQQSKDPNKQLKTFQDHQINLDIVLSDCNDNDDIGYFDLFGKARTLKDKFDNALNFYQEMIEFYAKPNDFTFDQAPSSIDELLKSTEELLTNLTERQKETEQLSCNSHFMELKVLISTMLDAQAPLPKISQAKKEIDDIYTSLPPVEKNWLRDALAEELTKQGKLTADQQDITCDDSQWQLLLKGAPITVKPQDKLNALNSILEKPQTAKESLSVLMNDRFKAIQASRPQIQLNVPAASNVPLPLTLPVGNNSEQHPPIPLIIPSCFGQNLEMMPTNMRILVDLHSVVLWLQKVKLKQSELQKIHQVLIALQTAGYTCSSNGLIGKRPYFHVARIHRNEFGHLYEKQPKYGEAYGERVFNGEYPAGALQLLRAIQRTEVEIALSEIKKFLASPQTSQTSFKKYLQFLESLILHPNDRVKGKPNFALNLYEIFTELRMAKRIENPSLADPNDPQFNGQFGRTVFFSDEHDIAKLQAIQKLEQAIKAAWKMI